MAYSGVRGTEYNSTGISPFEGLRPNNREGTQPRPSTENWIKDLLSVALSEQDPYSHSKSLPMMHRIRF